MQHSRLSKILESRVSNNLFKLMILNYIPALGGLTREKQLSELAGQKVESVVRW
jgi:hypothetical protein